MINDASGFTPWEDRRVAVISGVIFLGFLGLVLRLFFLQVVKGSDLAQQAALNSTQILPLLAPRGLMYVHHGSTEEPVLENAPRFSLFYSYSEKNPERAQKVETELCSRLPGLESVITRKMAEAKKNGRITRVLTNIPSPTALALMERRLLLPGVHILVEQQRRARSGIMACHLIGHVGEVDEAELRRGRDAGLRPGQWVGKNGLEKTYDVFLRGTDGGLQFEVDAVGRHVKVVRQIPPTPGQDIHLTLEKKVQTAAETGLAGSVTGRGAAVAIDPQTGAVLAMASAPGFDPSGNLADYLGDPDLPFFNRAIQGVYPPGSVFKIVTALAALHVGWDTRRWFVCDGTHELGDRVFGCWSVHGKRDFFGAVAWSCNVYFFHVGRAIGIDPIEALAKSFGFGEKSGLDLPGESTGLIPGRAWKKRTLRQGWWEGDTLNASIGQGAVTATPLQAAVFTAAVANGGKVFRPYLVERVSGSDGKNIVQRTPEVRRTVDLGESVWVTIHKAMEGVAREGSGRVAYRSDLVIGAKTGTAQNPHGEDHSWFAAYAGRPGEPARLAVAVFVENGGHGSAAAGPVAKEMINAYFPL